MTTNRFVKLCMDCYAMLIDSAPYDTGNLANNSIKIEFQDENTCKIYIDEAIAPYMPYTNEPWIAERWQGKKNPNENWFDYAVQDIVEFLASRTKGELKK